MVYRSNQTNQSNCEEKMMMKKNNARALLSPTQAAKFCNCSDSTIKRLLKSGRIEYYMTPGGHYKIYKDDLIRFMSENGIPVYEEIEIIRKKVLIVDDDEHLREGMARYIRLNRPDIEPTTAADGFEAGVLLMRFMPDLVILDLIMPGMNGFEVCRKIKENPSTRNITVIVLTGFGNEENKQKAYNCRADLVLFKPVDMEDLLQTIDNIKKKQTAKNSIA